MAELVKSKIQLVGEVIVAILLAAFVVYAPGMVGTLIPADSQLAPMIPVLVGIVYLVAYEFLSVEGLEMFKEAVDKLKNKTRGDDKASINPVAYLVAAALVILVVAAVIIVCVYHVDLLATLAGIFAVVVGVLLAARDKIIPKAGEREPPGPMPAETVTSNGITFTRRATDPTGIYVNEERKAVYIVWRGHTLKTVIAAPPKDYYTVYTKNGEQRDCVYADGVLYSTKNDPLEEALSKKEMLDRIEEMSGAEAIRWVIANLASRGEDADVLKLSLVWPSTYKQAVADMKRSGEWDTFIQDRPGVVCLPLIWENYLANTQPEFMKRDAKRLVEEYFKDQV